MDTTGSNESPAPRQPAPAAAWPDPAACPEAAAAWLDRQLQESFAADLAEPLPPRLLALLAGPALADENPG